MTTNPNILIAQAENIQELVSLINKAYKGEGSKGWTSETDIFVGSRIDKNELMELFSDENATILKYRDGNGAIVGCVYLQKQEKQMYLGLLSVSPDVQTSGVGKQLLIAAEEYAFGQNCDKIVLTVITIRHELVAWYKRRGYYSTGTKLFPQNKAYTPNQQLELLALEKKI
jgi:N-acetylglutamate synthase-like GNAT family acetyltransferase